MSPAAQLRTVTAHASSEDDDVRATVDADGVWVELRRDGWDEDSLATAARQAIAGAMDDYRRRAESLVDRHAPAAGSRQTARARRYRRRIAGIEVSAGSPRGCVTAGWHGELGFVLGIRPGTTRREDMDSAGLAEEITAAATGAAAKYSAAVLCANDDVYRSEG